MRRDGFVRPGNHRDPGMSTRMRVWPERVDRQRHPIPSTQYFKRRTGFDTGDEAELQAHGFGFHQVGDVFDFLHRDVPADAPQPVRHANAPGDAGFQQVLDQRDGGHGDDTGPAHCVHPLAGDHDAHQLLALTAHGHALVAGLFRCVVEHRRHRGIVGVGGCEVAQRAGELQDLIGGFLDLPNAFGVTDRPAIVLDADTQQR